MKQVKSFLTLAFALTALASCNKENEVPGMNPEVEGVPTYAAFSVKVSSTANTRATDAGVTEEQTVNGVRLLVFSAGVLESKGDVVVASAGDINTAVLKTTTGLKEIYAIVNPKADMDMALGTTLADFKAKAVAALSDDIAGTGAFVMIGKEGATLTKQDKAAALGNPITIKVNRAAAKVNMQYNPNTVVINTTALAGTFPDQPKYLVAQMNKTMFLPREGYELTPYGTQASPTYDHLTSIPADMTGAKTAPTSYDKAFASSYYTAENVNKPIKLHSGTGAVEEGPTTGNTTFVLVQLKYVPGTSEITGTTTPDKADGTFYVLWNKTSKTGKIYVDLTEANTAKGDDTNLEVKTYDKGMCYYRVNIRDLNQNETHKRYCVLRNHYYQINITSINSLGGSTTTDPDVVVPTDPDTPLETETFISAEINVLPWNAIIMNEPLG